MIKPQLLLSKTNLIGMYFFPLSTNFTLNSQHLSNPTMLKSTISFTKTLLFETEDNEPHVVKIPQAHYLLKLQRIFSFMTTFSKDTEGT